METINRVLLLLVAVSVMGCKDTSKLNHLEDEPKTSYPSETFKQDTVDSNNRKETSAALKAKLTAKGFEVFHYVNEQTKDTVLMQKYFMAFLKRGPIRNQNEEEVAILQKDHLAYLVKMYELGYADISGPFGGDGDISGITIYNVPTLKIADSLANSDPMVKSGRLIIEMHPWWAAKGISLR